MIGKKEPRTSDDWDWVSLGNGECRKAGNSAGEFTLVATDGMSDHACRTACAREPACLGYQSSKKGACSIQRSLPEKIHANPEYECYVRKDQKEWASHKFGEIGQEFCPHGYNPINDESLCKAAATAMKKQWKETEGKSKISGHKVCMGRDCLLGRCDVEFAKQGGEGVGQQRWLCQLAQLNVSTPEPAVDDWNWQFLGKGACRVAVLKQVADEVVSEKDCKKMCAQWSQCQAIELNKYSRCKLSMLPPTYADAKDDNFNGSSVGCIKKLLKPNSTIQIKPQKATNWAWFSLGVGRCAQKNETDDTPFTAFSSNMPEEVCQQKCAETPKCAGYEASNEGLCRLQETPPHHADASVNYTCHIKKPKDFKFVKDVNGKWQLPNPGKKIQVNCASDGDTRIELNGGQTKTTCKEAVGECKKAAFSTRRGDGAIMFSMCPGTCKQWFLLKGEAFMNRHNLTSENIMGDDICKGKKGVTCGCNNDQIFPKPKEYQFNASDFMWDHVGLGACRMADGSLGTFDVVASEGINAGMCRKLCAQDDECKGYESSDMGMCNLHKQPLDHVGNVTGNVTGTAHHSCYNKRSKTDKNVTAAKIPEPVWEYLGVGACSKPKGNVSSTWRKADMQVDTTLDECKKKCASSAACGSFQYGFRDKRCQIYNVSFETADGRAQIMCMNRGPEGFKFGPLGNDTCPDGYNNITDENTCKEGALYLGHPLRSQNLEGGLFKGGPGSICTARSCRATNPECPVGMSAAHNKHAKFVCSKALTPKNVSEWVWPFLGKGVCRTHNNSAGSFKLQAHDGMRETACRKACAQWPPCTGFQSNRKGMCKLFHTIPVTKVAVENSSECFMRSGKASASEEGTTFTTTQTTTATEFEIYDLYAGAHQSCLPAWTAGVITLIALSFAA
jgi:hypothetical protein